MPEQFIREVHVLGLNEILLPIGLFCGAILLGFIAEKIGLRYLQKWAEKTEWDGDDRIVDALRGLPVLWGALIGIFAVFQTTAIPEKYLGGINIGLIIVAIFSVTRLADKVVSTFMDHLGQQASTTLPGSSIFNNIVKLSIYIMGGLIVLHLLGIPIAPMITALGIGGLAVALALQDTLSNLFAGIQLILSKQINLGDYIRLGSGEEGVITDITWRNTTITAMQNHVIIVPNANLSKLNLTNFGRSMSDISFTVPVGVSYDSDLAHVEHVTIDVVSALQKDFPDMIPVFEPIVRFAAFADSSISINVILRTQEYRFQFAIRSHFIQRLHERYKAEGIEIPFPIRTLHIKGKETKPVDHPWKVTESMATRGVPGSGADYRERSPQAERIVKSEHGTPPGVSDQLPKPAEGV